MTALQPLIDAQANVAVSTPVEAMTAWQSTKLVLHMDELQADRASPFDTHTPTDGGPLQPSFDVLCQLPRQMRCQRRLKPHRLQIQIQTKCLEWQPGTRVISKRNSRWWKFKRLIVAIQSLIPNSR